jgi:hypothetical protein
MNDQVHIPAALLIWIEPTADKSNSRQIGHRAALDAAVKIKTLSLSAMVIPSSR